MVWRTYETVEYKGYSIHLLSNTLGYGGVWADIYKDGESISKIHGYLSSTALEFAKEIIDEEFEFNIPFPIIGE